MLLYGVDPTWLSIPPYHTGGLVLGASTAYLVRIRLRTAAITDVPLEMLQAVYFIETVAHPKHTVRCITAGNTAPPPTASLL